MAKKTTKRRDEDWSAATPSAAKASAPESRAAGSKASTAKSSTAKATGASGPSAAKSFTEEKSSSGEKSSVGEKLSTEETATPARRSRERSPAEALRALDAELLQLIDQRMALWSAIHADEKNKAAYDPAGDDAFYRDLQTLNAGALPPPVARRIFQEIIGASRAGVRKLRVAYLGPEYSFSHLAALQRFGSAADLFPVGTIATVFEEVNRGHASFGAVPIENSTDGRIVDTLAMFTRLPVRICGEVQLAIHLHLLANCPREQVTEIYSKPQALSQCRNWLARHMPKARLIDVTSTSTAAGVAKSKPGAAAVASAQAAVTYGLQTLAANIEDNPNNVTRFVVIGDDVACLTGNDRTALLMQIPDQPGALHDALSTFKKHGVNLTWIESFPLRGPEAGYQFFLDLEGHCEGPEVKKAIADLEKKVVRLDLLGSYPKSDVT